MATWHDILKELETHTLYHQNLSMQTMDIVRRKHFKSLAEYTNRNTIAYYSGWLTKPGVYGIEVNDDDMNALMACIHGLDRKKGLDLILHTPGGGIAATEAIVKYLRKMFGTDIRAIVPQLAMSAGTMMALSCRSIVLGQHSSLGPIDPQLGGIPADMVVAEFSRAFNEITEDPRKAAVWSPILSRYSPSFLSQCENACDWSRQFVTESLVQNMFAADKKGDELARTVVTAFASALRNKGHDRHLSADDVAALGVKVERLEDDPELQDLVLSVHHCFIHTLASSTALKIVENHEGRANIRHQAPQFAQVPMQMAVPQHAQPQNNIE